MKSITELLKAILTFRPAGTPTKIFEVLIIGNFLRRVKLGSKGLYWMGRNFSKKVLGNILKKMKSRRVHQPSNSFELCRHFVAFKNICFTRMSERTLLEWLKEDIVCDFCRHFRKIETFKKIILEKPESSIPAIKIWSHQKRKMKSTCENEQQNDCLTFAPCSSDCSNGLIKMCFRCFPYILIALL